MRFDTTRKQAALSQARRESDIYKIGASWHLSTYCADTDYGYVTDCGTYGQAMDARKRWVVQRTLSLMGLHPLADWWYEGTIAEAVDRAVTHARADMPMAN